MFTSILIIAVSTALFVYWFRYTCVLILSTRTTQDYSARVAADNRLSFAEVQGHLETAPAARFEAIQASLERDFRMVSSLLRQARGLKVAGNPLEELILRVDFHLMRTAYGISRGFSEARARMALEEMSQVVAHLANAFGERVASSASA